MNAAGGSEIKAVEAAQADLSGTAESLTPGELLRHEREHRSMTVQQAAEDLHLDASTVVAIEANRFEALGVPVYARGHLRKYAMLLGLSPEYIIERYEALSDRPAVPMPVPASITTTLTSVDLERRSFKGPMWMAVVLVALGVGWWIFELVTTPSSSDSSPPALTEEPPTVAAPEVAAPESVEPAAVTPAVSSPTVPPKAAPERTPATVAANARSAPPASGANEVRLRLEYSDASWTEVYDGTGRRLLFGLGDAGRVRVVTGTPPLRVTLGSASAVTVQVNDRAVVVPRQSGRDSAKFLIAANGAVQMTSGEVSVE